LVCVAAFGLLLPSLGFYWDDWRVVYIAQQGDLDALWRFFQYDRPLSAWTYILTLPVLGLNPLHWQFFNLGLRILVAALMWLTLREVWPKRRFTVAAAALLFAVYPSFTQQFIALSYSQHFIAYGLFFFSLWAMLRAETSPRRWAWTVAALAAAAGHLATMEYFAGLELTRPLLVFLFWFERGDKVSAARRKAWRTWLPYLGTLLAFFVWRLFFAGVINDPNRPSLLTELRAAPLSTLASFVEKSVADLIYILISPWDATLHPSLIAFSDASRLLSLGLSVLVAAMVFWLLQAQLARSAVDKQREGGWGKRVIWLGLAAILLGMLPVRLAERELAGGLFSDRFTLPALFGAALVWVGVARVAMRAHVYRALLVAALVGLSVGMHARVANDYRWDWEEQRREYWQLYWRAPALAANTALVFDGAFSAYVSEYAAAFAINTLYDAPAAADGRLPYWLLDFYDDPLEAGQDIQFDLRNYRFEAERTDVLYFDLSSSDHCLWLLSEADAHNSDADAPMRAVAGESQLGRIGLNGSAPDAVIFGPEPEHGWCYYFQKISLAVQMEDWDTALALWQEAQAANLRPNNQFEVLPVLRAMVASGDVDMAGALSLDALSKQQNVRAALCAFWAGQAENELIRQLSCS
jgi:hypothetical protein